jgi:hypothetical protein
MKSNIQVTFISGDDKPVGTIDMSDYMATLINVNDVMVMCYKMREAFNDMGEPLSFKIEISSEDI